MTYQPFANSPVKLEQPVPQAPPQIIFTRVELKEIETGLVYVEKYDEYWSATSNPMEQYPKKGDFDEMVAWLKVHGWDVIEWTVPRTGVRRARAWLGERLPVRTRGQIRKMRQRIAEGRLQVPNTQNDLAYFY